MHNLYASTIVTAVALASLLPADSVRAQQAQAAPVQIGDTVQQGMSRERLGRIAGVMMQEVARDRFPGAVTLIARRGEIIHFESHGFQDAAKTKTMAKDTVFRMASMTKPIVTVVAMMLVEQGVFKLNDPIADHLPELKDLKLPSRI